MVINISSHVTSSSSQGDSAVPLLRKRHHVWFDWHARGHVPEADAGVFWQPRNRWLVSSALVGRVCGICQRDGGPLNSDAPSCLGRWLPSCLLVDRSVEEGGVEDALLRPPASLSCHPAAQLRASVREETMLRCINLTHSALNASQSFTMPGSGEGGRRGVCTPPHIIVQICACWECNVMRALSGAALRRIITPQERGYYLMRPTACILSVQRLVEISDRDPLVKGQRNNKVLCSKAS